MADPRSERSRASLRQALTSLLDEKPFDKVTVLDILKRAGLSKQAFYNHYSDINSLVVDCYHHELLSLRADPVLLEHFSSDEEYVVAYLENTAHLFDFFRTHSQLARVIANNIGSSPYFTTAFEGEVASGSAVLAKTHGPVDAVGGAVDFDAVSRYVNGGWVALIQGWIFGGMQESSEVMAKRCQILCFHCEAILTGGTIKEGWLRIIREWHRDEPHGA